MRAAFGSACVAWVGVAWSGMPMADRAAEAGDPERGYRLSTPCASCHDGDGRTRYGLYPRIAGQHYAYLLSALREFRTKERHQAFAFQMWDPVRDLSDQDLRDLAAYYARLPW